MEEKLIQTIELKNRMKLTLYDGSRKLAGDRWLIKLIARMEIPVSDVTFHSVSQTTETANEIQNALGEKVLFEQKRERFFIDETEKETVFKEVYDNFVNSTLEYLSNDAFQERHFGRQILSDEQLTQYAFWYKGLSSEQKLQWDQFLAALDPNEDVQGEMESFRFKNIPPPVPDSDGAVTLLSDLPRNMIIEGLKMNKQDHQESDSQEPPQAQQQSFIVRPIGRVVKEHDRTLIVINKEHQAGLSGLEKHDYVTVVYWFDRNDTPDRRAILQVHPRGDANNPLTGVFATHSPVRPNLIAISKCDIISVEENVIEIKDIDAFDGSPVLDLKGDFFRFYRPPNQE